MSQVELLTRAIEKLETLQGGSPVDPTNELFVTLNRTIDPLYSWLMDQFGRMMVEEYVAGIPLRYRHAIAMAHAVLGDDV